MLNGKGWALPILGILASLALVACGSSSDDNKDNDAITSQIERAATSGDPAACTDAQTQAFTAQTNGSLKDCQQSASDTAADTVDVSDIKVDGDSATAQVKAIGSILDGQTFDVALIKDGDTWKLDKLGEFTDFDRDAFIAKFGAVVAKEAPPQAVDCIQKQLQSASDADLEAIITTPHGGESLFANC
jgi:hypothetical protein